MDSREKSERYGKMISSVSPAAEAAGRREPYHLTFLKKTLKDRSDAEKAGRKCSSKNSAVLRLTKKSAD